MLKNLTATASIFIVMFITAIAIASSNAYTGNEGMQILWHFNQASHKTATNSAKSGSTYDGTLHGHVTAGASGIVNGAYKGFTFKGSFVEANKSIIAKQNSYTLEMWVKNPKLNFAPHHWWDASTAVLARIGNSSANHNVAWQLSVQNSGAFRVADNFWDGKSWHFDGQALSWSASQWYYVAIVWDHTSGDNYKITVYRAPVGSKQVQSVLTTTVHKDPPGSAKDNKLLVGAANESYYSNPGNVRKGSKLGAQAGYFGGLIDEVVLWDGTRTQKQLNYSLTMVPAPKGSNPNPPAPNSITLKSKGVKLVAQSAKNITLYATSDSGNQKIVKITGYQVKYHPSVKTNGGTIKKTEVNGHPTLQVDYKLKPGAPKNMHIQGQFILKPHHLQVRFDVTGIPKKHHLGGSMIGRHIAKGSSRKLFMMGRWVYDNHGGVPYEVRDGHLVRFKWNNTDAWFGFPSKTHASWKSGWAKQCPLKKIDDGHWQANLNIFLTNSSWRSRAVAARWHKRPIGLSVWTDKNFNWWKNNKKPLKVHVQLVNTSDHVRRVPLHYWARNYQGDFMARGVHNIYMKPGHMITRTLSIKAQRPRTILFLKVAAGKGSNQTFLRTTLSVLPPHQFKSTPKNSIFGISNHGWILSKKYKSLFMPLLQRMGVRWLRGGNSKKLAKYGIKANRHNSIHPYDKYKGKPKARKQWIKKQLRICQKHGNPWWEFENEANALGSGINSGSPKVAKVFTKYYKEIQRLKKKMGIDVKIMNGGLAGMDVKYVKNLHKDGAWQYLDGFAMHPGRGNFVVDYPVKTPWQQWKYGSHGNYWNYLGAVQTANHLLKKYGQKPLWLTEVYALTYPNHWWNDTQRQAAQNMILSYATGAAEGARCVMFYQLCNGTWAHNLGVDARNREFSFGLLFRDLSFKPALMAYCAIAENLDQAKFVRWIKFNKSSRNRGLLFNTPRGPLAILWNRADGYIEHKKKGYVETEPWVKTWKTKTPVELPTTSKTARVLNAIGQQKTIKANNGKVKLMLTGAPKMVYGIKFK